MSYPLRVEAPDGADGRRRIVVSSISPPAVGHGWFARLASATSRSGVVT